MTDTRLVLLDGDLHTASQLAAELSRRSLGTVKVIAGGSAVASLIAAGAPDVVIVNHRFDQPDGLVACSTVKRLAPETSTVVVVSAGPALLAVQTWARQTRSIDVIVEKPFSDERLFLILAELLAIKAASREARSRADRLANLVPAGALSAGGDAVDPQAEVFDAAVLFTDIRDSSRLITQMPPREFFTLLNRVLSEQTARIHAGEGSVVKYTGDGVMAIFRGMGRSYLALRCGLELAAMSRRLSLPYGVGIAQGLVLAGLIGDSRQTGQRRQFDVIGATAHLAARLCAMANAGDLVATRRVNAVAGVQVPAPRAIEKVFIRGFDQAIDCVAFTPDEPSLGALHETAV